MQNITLTGLTQKQVDLLDIMWSMHSLEEFEAWQETLSAEQRHQSELLQQLVILELADKEVDSMDLQHQAKQVLDQFRLTK